MLLNCRRLCVLPQRLEGVWRHRLLGLQQGGREIKNKKKKKRGKERGGLRLSEELSRAGDGAACCCCCLPYDVCARARNISLAALPPCVTCRAHPLQHTASIWTYIDSFQSRPLGPRDAFIDARKRKKGKKITSTTKGKTKREPDNTQKMPFDRLSRKRWM
jgi:hypothetical protein